MQVRLGPVPRSPSRPIDKQTATKVADRILYTNAVVCDACVHVRASLIRRLLGLVALRRLGGAVFPFVCACTHVVVDHPSGWGGAAGGAWTRHPRRLPTRGRICVRQRVCAKGFSLRVPSPFTLGASARTTYARYVRAYVRTDADVAVCVFGWVGGLCPKAYE